MARTKNTAKLDPNKCEDRLQIEAYVKYPVRNNPRDKSSHYS